MKYILRYSIFILLIFITQFSSIAFERNYAHEYSNIEYQVNIENTAPIVKYEKKETSDINSNFIGKSYPVVSFTISDNEACSGTAIKFESTVTEGTAPFKYNWDFGDGQKSTDKNPTHRFTALGCGTKDFKVKLTVTDADDNSSDKEEIVTVKQKPDISFSDKDDEFGNDPFNNCDDASEENPSYSITVENNSSGSCVNLYSIKWGDGNTESDIKFPISHTYEHLGAFKMVITAKGENDCVNVVLFTVKNQTNPSGGINSPGETAGLCTPTDELRFTISEWGKNSPGTRYEVDYADGTGIHIFYQDDMMTSKYYNASDPTSSENFPIPHSYNISNCPDEQFIVNMDIINECLTTPASVGGITVYAVPEADFTAPSSCANTNIAFTNKTIAGYNNKCKQEANYTWDFGDGSPILEIKNSLPQNASASHTYTTPGVYNVILTAKNSTCGETSKTKQITISLPPTATISGGAEVCVGDPSPVITFTGADGTAPYTFTYKKDNGSNISVSSSASSNIATIEASTSTAGTFTYTLVNVSSSSCSQSQTGIAVIIVNGAPTATIAGTVELCIDDPESDVTFTGANGTAPYTFTYNIDGGTNKTVTTITGNTISIKAPTDKEGVYKYNLIGVKDAGSGDCSMPPTGSATITINDKPPTPDALNDLEVCNGDATPIINFSNGVSGITFEWTNSNVDIGLPSSGTGNIQSFIAKNSTAGSIVSTVTVIAINNGCTSESQSFTITINPAVSVFFSEADQTICSGETTTKVLLSSIPAGADLIWSTEQPSGIAETIILSGTDVIESQTLTNTTNSSVSIIYTAKATSTGTTPCSGTEYKYTITVNPKPLVSSSFKDTICSGEPFSLSPENGGGNIVPNGTEYTWGNPVINPSGAITGAIEETTPQSTISQTLGNTSTSIATATYTITPVASGCTGGTFDLTVYVIPGATLLPIDDITLCDEEVNPEIDFGTPPEGIVYKWSTDNANIGLPGSSGTGNIPEFTAINKEVSPVTATMTVTPEGDFGDSDCGGTPIKFTITVNPKVSVSGSLSDTICSSATLSYSPKNGGGNIIPNETKYTWSNPVINPSGAITGASEETTPQPVIVQTLINTTTVVATATYIVTPTTKACAGDVFDLVVYVIPGGTLLPVDDIRLCNEEVNPEIDFGTPPQGTIYKWSSDNVDIGLPAFSGNGNIPEFTAINNGISPITATITVTPEGDFGDSDCGGTPIQFSITVNPTGKVDNPDDTTVCSGEIISIDFTDENTGGTTIYEWTITNTDIGLEASGTGNISFTSINTEDSTLTSVITVIPTFSNDGVSCIGAPEQFVIRVNPIPIVDQTNDQTICNGSQTTEVIFSGDIPSAVYYWSANDTSIGIPPNGTGNIPEFTAVNNEADSVITIITVIPRFNGCDGTPKDFKIIVHPSAKILKQPSSSTVCLGEKPVTLSVIHTTGVKIPNYQWYSNTSNSLIGGILIENETNDSFDPPSAYTTTMYYYCIITFSSGGCGTITTDIARIRVNPNPYIILNNEEISRYEELKLCEGDTIPIKAGGAETYIWNGGTVSDSLSLTNIGDYRVVGISNVGCTDTFYFSASYYDLMNYTIQSDKTEVTKDQNEVQFWTEDIPPSFYSWDFGDGTTGTGYTLYHTYDITQDGYFDVKLEVINPTGCIEQATKRIWVTMATIPNTFTPNGDGINDYYLVGWKLEIYNRNGILLYKGDQGWDGNYNGNPVANDTYFVVIYDSAENGTTFKTNYVTVIR